ncbi:MAG: N-6 DNA methylase, partial [Candidatus Hadarchaeales archaeon]
GAILIFRKRKPAERKGKILFINASQEYEKHPEVRKLNRLGEANIRKIVEAYRNFRDVEGFARVVSLEEIKENDYKLNVTLYVFPEEEVEEIDVAKEWEELRKIEKEIQETESRIQGYLEEVK